MTFSLKEGGVPSYELSYKGRPVIIKHSGYQAITIRKSYSTVTSKLSEIRGRHHFRQRAFKLR